MTPYYSEETVYSRNDLDLENEDGVSIIFYLQKIFPGSNTSVPAALPLFFSLFFSLLGLLVCHCSWNFTCVHALNLVNWFK